MFPMAIHRRRERLTAAIAYWRVGSARNRQPLRRHHSHRDAEASGGQGEISLAGGSRLSASRRGLQGVARAPAAGTITDMSPHNTELHDIVQAAMVVTQATQHLEKRIRNACHQHGIRAVAEALGLPVMTTYRWQRELSAGWERRVVTRLLGEARQLPFPD